jgi:hypothetical protein
MIPPARLSRRRCHPTPPGGALAGEATEPTEALWAQPRRARARGARSDAEQRLGPEVGASLRPLRCQSNSCRQKANGTACPHTKPASSSVGALGGRRRERRQRASILSPVSSQNAGRCGDVSRLSRCSHGLGTRRRRRRTCPLANLNRYPSRDAAPDTAGCDHDGPRALVTRWCRCRADEGSPSGRLRSNPSSNTCGAVERSPHRLRNRGDTTRTRACIQPAPVSCRKLGAVLKTRQSLTTAAAHTAPVEDPVALLQNTRVFFLFVCA